MVLLAGYLPPILLTGLSFSSMPAITHDFYDEPDQKISLENFLRSCGIDV